LISLLRRLPFKVVLFLAVLLIGLSPLALSISLNLSKVLAKFTELTEVEHVNQMNDQVHEMEFLLRRYKEDMRIIGQLPGVRSLVSAKEYRHAGPVIIKKQLTTLLGNLFGGKNMEELSVITAGSQINYTWHNPLVQGHDTIFNPATRIGLMNLWIREARERQPGSIFIASLRSDAIFRGDHHEHSPKIILAIPLLNQEGTFAGVAVGKFFLFDRSTGHISYDLMTNGIGTVFYDRSAPKHVHVGFLGHQHQQTTILPIYPDLIKATPETRFIFCRNERGEKILFRQVLPDKHKEHSLWIGDVVDTSLLDQWKHAFILRFLSIVSILVAAALLTAILIVRKTDHARGQLINGVSELVNANKPINLQWRWPAELAELSRELHELSMTLLATEESLQSQSRFIRGVFDGIQDGVAVINMDYVVVDSNQTLKNWRQEIAPLTGKKCYQVFRLQDTQCTSCPSKRAMEKKSLQRDEFFIMESDGHERWYEVSAYPIFDEQGEVNGIVEFFRDISQKKQGEEEKRNLEQQLIFAQKMESIGTLAGGVAHDFNNMLTAINGYAELSLMKMTDDDPHRHAMESILRSGKNAARITQQLLAFSRKQIIHLEPLDLNFEIEETRKMLNRLLGEHIEVVVHADENLWPIQADQTQITQVLINLAVNARDAMVGGGTLTITTANLHLNNEMGQTRHELPAGDYVLLTIADTGQGMSRETMAHIYEPFFTTKEQGKGTGLGLATSYGIIRQHGGSIHVYSEPGQGTVFKIYLPGFADQPADVSQEQCCKKGKAGGGHETILLVEDDSLVRAICVEILKHLGYTVLEAKNGEDGLEVFKQHNGTIDLLLTDVIMPKMGGAELVQHIREIYPDIRVLFMSGYTENSIFHQGSMEEGIHFVHKPITPDSLAQAVCKALKFQPPS
jgi:PAS domain S-box-containing protein